MKSDALGVAFFIIENRYMTGVVCYQFFNIYLNKTFLYDKLYQNSIGIQ